MLDQVTKSSRMVNALLATAALLITLLAAAEAEGSLLDNHVWIHGAEDCSNTHDPAIETYKFDGEKTIDLGQRKLMIIPIPGHQSESIAIYDSQTKWLLTGDSVYPGIISVLDWNDYRQSIDRLVEFSEAYAVSSVMGSHIEMSQTPGLPYERGTLYQPNEASLALPAAALADLKRSLDQAGKKKQELTSGSIIIRPVPWFARVLNRILK